MFTSTTEAHLGSKHTCLDCQARFYDLNKTPAVCPKCHTTLRVVQRAVRQPGRRRRVIHD